MRKKTISRKRKKSFKNMPILKLISGVKVSKFDAHERVKGKAFASSERSRDTVTDWREIAKDRIKKYTEPGLMLKGARAKEGFSQVALAKKLGVTQANLSEMEHGKRSIGKQMAKRLAKVLKVDYRTFL